MAKERNIEDEYYFKNFMDLGKLGYEAYCEQTGGKSVITGDKLPPFEKTPKSVQLAWACAARAIAEECE